MPALSLTKPAKNVKRTSGVRYQRVEDVVFIGHAAAHRLILIGAAVKDESRSGFAIRQLFKPAKPTGKSFVVRERWGDQFKAFALVDPHTNDVVASVHERRNRSGLGMSAWAQGGQA